jgi:hypothetical protein
MNRLMQVVQMAVVVAIAGAALYGLAYGWDDSAFKIAGKGSLGKLADSLGVDWIAPGEIDTSIAVDVRRCDKMTMYGYYAGDSCSWTLQSSLDGVHWANYASAATVNTDPAVAAAVHVLSQLAHTATVGSDKGVHFGDFMWQKARVIVNNVDHGDTLKSNVWRLYCGE